MRGHRLRARSSRAAELRERISLDAAYRSIDFSPFRTIDEQHDPDTTAHHQQPTPATSPEHTDVNAPTAELQLQLDQLQSEQQRRSELTPIQAASEQELRQNSAPEHDSFDCFDDPFDTDAPQYDRDLGL